MGLNKNARFTQHSLDTIEQGPTPRGHKIDIRIQARSRINEIKSMSLNHSGYYHYRSTIACTTSKADQQRAIIRIKPHYPPATISVIAAYQPDCLDCSTAYPIHVSGKLTCVSFEAKDLALCRDQTRSFFSYVSVYSTQTKAFYQQGINQFHKRFLQ